MMIIISPAKKMKIDTDSLDWIGLPQFLPEAEEIKNCLQEKTSQELQALWKCNDSIAAVNVERLEMQAKLAVGGSKDLYAYWGNKLAKQLCVETDIVINLASREYSRAVTEHLPKEVRLVTCIFGERIDGRIIEKGTMCKMARGQMMRWLAEHNVSDSGDIREFNRLGYAYSEEHSTQNTLVFVKRP